jgi:hypothetical protein
MKVQRELTSCFLFFSNLSVIMMLDLLYVKYAVAFITVVLAASSIFWLIKKIADLIIAIVLFGAFLIAYQGLNSGYISSWGELIASSILLGIIAGIICIPLFPFSSAVADSTSQPGKTAQQQNLEKSMQVEDLSSPKSR